MNSKIPVILDTDIGTDIDGYEEYLVQRLLGTSPSLARDHVI